MSTRTADQGGNGMIFPIEMIGGKDRRSARSITLIWSARPDRTDPLHCGASAFLLSVAWDTRTNNHTTNLREC